jgi:CDP-glycerol glycerophosphotransferase
MRSVARRIRDLVSYAAGHLRRRDARTWVFGNSKGFRDNPRYLAEHVANDDPRISPWWIARNASEADSARVAGLNVAMRGSHEAARVQRSAGAAFLSNGFQDLEPMHLGGAFVVDLRHGKGLKRVLLDLETPQPRGRLGRLAARLRRWLAARRLAQVDLIAAPGQMAAEMYRTAYAGPPSRIRVLGTPRFDVIHGGAAYERVAGPDPRGELELAADDYVVLWLPTYREAGDEAWLPRLDVAELEAAVEGTRIVILAKPHPYSDVAVFAERLPSHPRFRLLAEADVDANVLLRLADALVTDFSSAAFDFALLDRPIHFLVPDIETYRDGAGLYEPLETLTHGRQHADWPSLLFDVRVSALGRDPTDRDVAHRVRQRGGGNDAPGSCARIVAVVAAELRLAPGERSDSRAATGEPANGMRRP